MFDHWFILVGSFRERSKIVEVVLIVLDHKTSLVGALRISKVHRNHPRVWYSRFGVRERSEHVEKRFYQLRIDPRLSGSIPNC